MYHMKMVIQYLRTHWLFLYQNTMCASTHSFSIRQFLFYKVLGSKMNEKEWSFFDSAFARPYQASHVCLEKNNKQTKLAMEP